MSDYEEIFFQAYLDGDITYKEFIYYENKYIDFMLSLFSKSKCYVDCGLHAEVIENEPLSKCDDIVFDFDKVVPFTKAFIPVKDIDVFKQYCHISGREIGNVIFIFSDLKIIVTSSGLHGELFCENELNEL